MNKIFKEIILLTFLYSAFIFFATSCVTSPININSSINIEFRENNIWTAEIKVQMPVAVVTESPAINDELNELIQKSSNFGVTESHTTYRQDDDVIYIINLNGNDFNSLSQIVFDGQATIQSYYGNGREKIKFQINSWLPNASIQNFSLFLTGGQVISGNGNISQNEIGYTISWQVDSEGQEITSEFFPLSCRLTSPTDLKIKFLPDEYWYVDFGISPIRSNCSAQQIMESYETIVDYSKDIGVLYVGWSYNLDSIYDDLQLQIEGQTIEKLNTIVFDDQGNFNRINIEGLPQSIKFDVENTQKIGFNIKSLEVVGSEILQGNGNEINHYTMRWTGEIFKPSFEIQESSPLFFTNTKLTLNFGTGQHWDAILEVFIPKEFFDYSFQIEQDLKSYFGNLPHGLELETSKRVEVGSEVHTIHIEGYDLQMLNSILFHNNASFFVIDDNWNRQITFKQNSEHDWPFHSLSFRINGGEIIDSNGVTERMRTNKISFIYGNKDSYNSVTWNQLELGDYATFTEKLEFNAYAILDLYKYYFKKIIPHWLDFSVFLIFLLFLIGCMIFWRHIKKSREPILCSTCDYEIPKEAMFCPNCGEKRLNILREYLSMRKIKVGKEKNNSTKFKNNNTHIHKNINSTEINATFITNNTDADYSKTVTTDIVEKTCAVLRLGNDEEIYLPESGQFILNRENLRKYGIELESSCQLSISRARINYFIENLNKTEDIFINGKKLIISTKLCHNDLISNGSFQVQFILGSTRNF